MSHLTPVRHDQHLSLVEHLDELRSRIIVTVIFFAAAFAFTFWQNQWILDIANGPLPQGREPLTFSVAEPFLTTVTNAVYAAALISLPLISYQAYAYIVPAFTPKEHRLARPLLLMMPVLFIAGVVFAYFIVAPAAIHFLLGFNAEQFNIQIRAREYYSFLGLTLLIMGLIFQLPVAVMAAVRLGITTVKKLRSQRKYAYLIIALVAAALPGTDPVTMLIEMIPLLALFELGLLLASIGRRGGNTATME